MQIAFLDSHLLLIYLWLLKVLNLVLMNCLKSCLLKGKQQLFNEESLSFYVSESDWQWQICSQKICFKYIY